MWRITALASLAMLAIMTLRESLLRVPPAALLPLMKYTGNRAPGTRRLRQQYQARVIAETAIFRPEDSDADTLFSRFWDHWQQERDRGTRMGERIFIPMNIWSCVYKCDSANDTDQQMGPYIHGLDRSFRYFVVTGMDKGLHMWGAITPLPPDLDLLVFHAGGSTRGAQNIELPLLQQIASPRGLAKDVTVSAAFSTGTHGMRSVVNETWHSWGPLEGFVWEEDLSPEDFYSLLERSNFTMAPRGNGVSSYRLFEALQLGTIPVYIWKYTLALPFAELIDWDSVAVIMEVHQIETLLDVIRGFDVEKAQRNMAAMRHMWTYEYVNAYIVRRLATEHRGLPVPKATVADDPGCDCAAGCEEEC